MKSFAVCALIGMSAAKTNQAYLHQLNDIVEGPEDLMAIQTEIQGLNDKEWKAAKNTYGQEIYDEDGDGVEDNLRYTHHELDKFYKPNNFFPTEDLYNTRHGNLPGHVQRYWYKKQEEPESRDLVTKPVNNPDPTTHHVTITDGFGWGH